MGAASGSYGLLPASGGGLSQVTDGAWQGGDSPWTYTGGVTGNVNFGLGFHAASCPVGDTATLTYFGDKVTIFYARTVAGPTACAVTVDGVAGTPINARGTALAGQQSQFGTAGDYGFHTVVVTPNDGTLVLEGAQWFDGDAPFFIVGSVQVMNGEHAGFGAKDFASLSVSTDWTALFQGADAFMGLGMTILDVNDIAAGRTAAQFQADLQSIVTQIDGRLGTTTLPWLFVTLPYSADTIPFRNAMYAARAALGVNRCAVLDLAGLRPGRSWGSDLSADGTHPNDAGHIWVAEQLIQVLDPVRSAGINPVTQKRTVIDASTPPDGRTASWPDNWVALPEGGYNQSGGGTTLAELRYRFWADAGTYRMTVEMQEDNALGTTEILMGRWVGNTPTLTSAGTKANVAVVPTLVTTRLGTTIVNDIPGWMPVVVRKTTAAGAIRFVSLVIDKIA